MKLKKESLEILNKIIYWEDLSEIKKTKKQFETMKLNQENLKFMLLINPFHWLDQNIKSPFLLP